MPMKKPPAGGDQNDDSGHMNPMVWAAFIQHGEGGHLALDPSMEPRDEGPATSPEGESTPPSAPEERIFPIRRAPVEAEHWQCPEAGCTHRVPGDDAGPYEDECCPLHHQALKQVD